MLTVERANIKKKEAGNGPFKKIPNTARNRICINPLKDKTMDGLKEARN